MRCVEIRTLLAGVACAVIVAGCGSPGTTQSPPPSSHPTVAATPSASQLPSATATVVPSPKAPSGSFTATGSLGSAREGATATTLRDGRVLIAGGENGYEGTYETAELYDPSSGTFSPTGSMAVQRFGHTATLLADGRVLVVGGDTASAELYDPATGTFSPTGSMSAAGRFHAAVLLADGRVLIAGGEGSVTAELYDPATGKFSPAGSIDVGPGRMLDQPTNAGGAIVLQDGRVLLIETSSRRARLYDPANGKFTSTGSMKVAREAPSATLLGDGRVLVSGGLTPRTGQIEVNPNDALASAEIYDPATGTFSLTGSMIEARYDQGALLLDDGRVLVIGGDDSDGASSCEIFDPATATFQSTGSMPDTRGMYALTRLADGRVLLVGGSWYGHIAGSETALIYQP
jgi:hypothetical protein